MLAIMLLFAVVAIGIRCLPARRSVALSRRVKVPFRETLFLQTLY